MKYSFFEYPSYRYQIDDWNFKKRGLVKRIESQKFLKTDIQNFYTDRKTNNKNYLHYFNNLIEKELEEFCNECGISCVMTDCWSVKYEKGDYQTVHNHRSTGFSGILYVQYDPKVHTPTHFVAPWQDPRIDTTIISCPENISEGTLLIFPSYTLHYVPPNHSNKIRIITSFDLMVKIP